MKYDKHQFLSAITALILFFFGITQIIMGEFVTKSVALTANGIDCMGDGLVSVIVWIGLRVSSRPSDQSFHYGYHKMENLASIAAATVMMILGSYIAYRSYEQFIHPHAGEMPFVGAIVAFLAAVFAIGIGIYKYLDSRKLKREALKLEAFNTIKDGIASLLTVVALIFYGMGFTIADALAGSMISIIIFSIGFSVIKEASLTLADACDGACIDQKMLIGTIVQEICNTDKSKKLEIKLRKSGPILQGELFIEVPGTMTINEVTEIKKKIHAELKHRAPTVEPLTIIAVPLSS